MILNGDQYPPANIGLPTFISQTVIHGVFYTKLRNRERIYSDLFQSKNNAGQKKLQKIQAFGRETTGIPVDFF